MSISNELKYKRLEDRSKITNLFLRYLLFIILGLFAFYFFFPLYVMLVTSFKTMDEIRQGNLLILPSHFLF